MSSEAVPSGSARAHTHTHNTPLYNFACAATADNAIMKRLDNDTALRVLVTSISARGSAIF